MNAAKVVMGDVKADRSGVMGELFGEAIRQPGEALLAHAEREVLTLNVARADL